MAKSYRMVLGAGAGIAILALVSLAVLTWMRSARLTPEFRGQELAIELGCVSCHGPGGTGGNPNPGSEEEEVPAWDGGTAMMYVKSDEEIREWIMDGAPERLREKHEHEHGNHDPHALPFHMPAYRDYIDGDQLEDLVAYYKAVSNFRDLPPQARAGYKVAARSGCFGCHGPAGLVGGRNPKAFKRYIPPWRGDDFQELVRNDDELRSWILYGRIDRLESNPAARWFTRRQAIQMPAYGESLDDNDVAAIVDYIHWLNESD